MIVHYKNNNNKKRKEQSFQLTTERIEVDMKELASFVKTVLKENYREHNTKQQ